MDNDSRVAKAKRLVAAIAETVPVAKWGFSTRVWTTPRGDVRVYVDDKKRKPAAILVIDEDGNIQAQWKTGHSLTRNELRAALGL